MESTHDDSAVVSHDQSTLDVSVIDSGRKAKTKKPVDQAVVDQIMNGLKDGQPRKTLEIAKFCGFQTKQEVNPTLYYMQKQRLLAKVLESPPTWQLNSADPVVNQFHSNSSPNFHLENAADPAPPPPPTAMGAQPMTLTYDPSALTCTSNVSMTLDPNASMSDQILEVIAKSDPEPSHSNAIAKAIGFRNKKQINPTLFDLQRKGLLQKIQDSPPLWIITNAGREIVEARPPRTKTSRLEDVDGTSPESSCDTVADTVSSSLSETIVAISNPASIDALPVTVSTETPMPNTVAADGEKDPKLEMQELSEKVLFTLLRAENCTSTAVAVAKALGFPSKRSVNPSLFKLQSKGLTAKISDCPPVWSLTPAGVDQARQIAVNPSFVHSGITDSIAALSLASGASSAAGSPSAGQMSSAPSAETQSVSRSAFSTLAAFNPDFAGKPLINAGGIASSSSLLNVAAPLSSTSSNSAVNAASGRRVSPPAAAAVSISGDSFAMLNKNPVSALTEFSQARRISTCIEVLSQSGPPHDPRFTIAVFMGNRRFPSVVCKSKKEGKREAADAALRELIAEGEYIASASANAALLTANNNLNSKKNVNGEAVGGGNGPTSFVMSWADEIAALAHRTFNSLALQITEFISGRKVLAAIIMKREPPQRKEKEPWMADQVVSLGTGNRCIVGTRMSLEGLTVNDCHAEVISRRGFLRFLYHKLLSYDANDPESIYESAGDDNDMLRLKPEVSFHMYISTAPCGDGALFSPRDNEIYELDQSDAPKQHRPTFTSSVQGVLRTKMEGGEGTIPMEPDMEPQTWDGIIRGERLRTMSCSDKIAKWNVTGIQGALLSQFLEPIYLSSVTLGYLFDFGHLSRALCCRLKGSGEAPLLPEEQLPAGYRLNHPELGRVTVYDPPRETEKTKSISINWTAGDEKAEVCDGSQGLCVERYSEAIGSQTSHLCKKNLYGLFNEVCDKFDRPKYDNYLSAKRAAKEFQAAKRLAEKAFVAGGYGHWLKKPVEEQMFE